MKKFLPIFTISLLGLVIFSGLSFGNFWYRPTITWSPPKIEEEQFPGTAKVLTATFTSKKDLENVKFWLTPPLSKYAVVEPESIDKVEKNQEYSVQIIVSLPSDVLSKTYKELDLDNDIKGLGKELKDYLGKHKDSKEYLKKFLKQRIPGLLFVTSEKSVPWFKFWWFRFWRKAKERKIRVVHPKALRIMVKVKEPTAEEIPIDEVSLPTLERIYEDPETGAIYVRDEVIMGFEEGTSEAKIKEIVAEVNGVFLGSDLDLGLYQVLVPVTGPSELELIIQQLEDYPEVRIATYHGMVRLNK